MSQIPLRVSAKARVTLIILGLVILLAGFSGAAWVWPTQDTGERQIEYDDGTLSRRDAREVEIYYGKVGVLIQDGIQKLGYLTTGKPLAGTLAVISLVAAGVCFTFASRYPVQFGQSIRGEYYT